MFRQIVWWLTALWNKSEPLVCTRAHRCILDREPCNGWPRAESMEDFHRRRATIGIKPFLSQAQCMRYAELEKDHDGEISAGHL